MTNWSCHKSVCNPDSVKRNRCLRYCFPSWHKPVPLGRGDDRARILHAARALRAGPSLVFTRSGATGDPITDALTIFGVDIVWCPGLGGRFLAPVASER